jgi:hypothetical protein
MENNEKLKLVFDFIADYLSDTKSTKTEAKKIEVPVNEEPKLEATKVYLDENKEKEVNHILNVMKHAEIIDKYSKKRGSKKIVPINERDIDEDEIVKMDKTIVENHTKETSKMENFLSTLKESKNILDELEVSKPITSSIPPPVLNEMIKDKNK